MSLEPLLKKRIAAKGPITIADYMEAALSHPEFGYYMRKDPFGVKGDFITAPEVSQIFGEILSLWLAEQWRILGKPEITLIELGPGRGTLMADMLRATKMVAGFHDAISIRLIETSPTLKQKQWQTLAGKHPRLQWQETLSDLPAQPVLFIANEFFDALPIRQFVRSGKEWQERAVGVEKEKLVFTTLEPSKLPPLPKEAKDGVVYESCEPALAITTRIGKHIKKHGGAALVIDYGYEGGTRGDTLQAVKSHQYHDVLTTPGEADITAHVDFDAIKEAATTAGAVAFGPTAQGAFLGRLGAITRATHLCEGNSEELQATIMSGLERLLSPEKMGDRFKALAIMQAGAPKPEGF